MKELGKSDAPWLKATEKNRTILESKFTKTKLRYCQLYEFRGRATNNICPGRYSSPIEVKTGCEACPGNMVSPTTVESAENVEIKWTMPIKKGKSAINACQVEI